MSLLQNINTQVVPFSLLNTEELDYMAEHMDVGYFQKGETIIAGGGESEGLHLIIKGFVCELEAQDQNASHTLVHYGAEDYFGAWSAIRGRSIHDFVADEETICYILPAKHLLELIYRNSHFGDYFNNQTLQQDLLANNNPDLDMAEFMLATVGTSCMHDALVIEATADIEQATRLMREQKAESALVQRGRRYGMITRTDLLNALVLDKLPTATPVKEIANYRLVTVEANDYLFNALVRMTSHDIDRVVVMTDGQLQGVVELTEALSFFSSHSHVVGLRIERASTVEELAAAAKDMDALIRSLHKQGVKVRFLMDLLAALNKRLMAKLFNLLVPEDVIPHVCLVVMGSEGRGEQITKTDQDNGLIMRDSLDWPNGPETMREYARVLQEIGFPPCPGEVMVSNPFWVQPISEWTKRMQDWVNLGDEESILKLSIAVDAAPVAGNAALYKTSRNWFFKEIQQHQRFLTAFAKVATVFDTPLTLLGSIRNRSNGIDLKRGGIFPIVHGVRTMALQYQIPENNTFSRITALVDMGVLPRRMGHELQEAFGVFHLLRVKAELGRIGTDSSQDSSKNMIDIDDLDRLEKDTLRQAFHVVKEFKQHLGLRYQFGGGL
ncbi:MAG TPA: cyclic nucleotide-binding protein [Oceanospirillaceae bacterium]|nr:cyclic nucleotide-binding protein [Oceanospirillaceae bacterium]